MIRAWKNIFRIFARSQQGSVLPLVAAGMFALMAATGAAIDMGRQQIVQTRMQNALDSAGLAAGTAPSGANLNTVVSNYFYANFPATYLGVTVNTLTVTPNALGSVLNLTATGTLNTTFMNLFGIKTMTVSAASQITKQSEGMELVLVLDNTGSMNCEVTNESNCSTSLSDSKINALKSAGATLLNILYGGASTIPNLWVGVVPFSQTVNIGTGYPTWMNSIYDATLEFGPTITGTSCQNYNSGDTTTLAGGSTFDNTKATGVITFTSNPASGKTIVLNGVTWTFVSGTASGNQTKIGANLSSTMTTLASNLNASSNSSIKLATYYGTSTMLEITYKTAGTAGNAYTLSSGTSPASVTAASNAGTYSSTPKCTYTLNGNSAAAAPFLQMTNWGGCVMARSAPYDTSDDPPSVSPFQAYDYPPTADGGVTYDPWMTVTTSGSAPYTTTTTYNYSYQSSLPGNYGPNLFCPQTVLPMVAEESTVLSKINSLTAGGSTLIDIGMAWGQRMLSPRWTGLWGGEMNSTGNANFPALPLPYHTALMQKVLILMTDGMNQLDPNNFTAYQYLDNGVLGTTNYATANSTLDSRTLSICTALKNNGVIIYTIGFGTQSDVNTSLLTSCATDAGHFFLAPTNAQLTAAFQTIGNSLANLYISH